MTKISRRALARYAANQLTSGRPAGTLAKQLTAVLAESGRSDEVTFLLDDIAWELEQRQKLAIGRLTSAIPLSEQLEAAIKAQLKKAVKTQEIMLEKQIDKSVLGGIRIETASRVWDLTLSRKLTELREAF